MKLIGSTPSPFVRRVRMWAAQNNVDLALVNLDIFSEQNRPTLANNNPASKIPVLIDGDLTLSDSTIILRYLIAKAKKNTTNLVARAPT
ncbi:glutathione S-transferase family protein [Pseudoalteromonas agarivorans]|uniref:glutathione S-transferase family protein n=1 Tax=Pseudoalteromonas agarivorans TaxID=176102 RepID=UPI00249A9F4C|nr:glutathione S-transferase family protein [Pseudoalteromonas agarivorans]MDI3245203.1 glutathione S-transferase family protein [Pseudoalteromonas agarivorans]